MSTVSQINPFTLATIAERDYDDRQSIAEKLAAVRGAGAAWASLPCSERVGQLREALGYFERNGNSIASELTALMGKPFTESRNELRGFFERAKFLLENAESTLAPETLPEIDGFHRRIEHVPLGVVFIISAWNYPLMIALNGVLAALLAGNTVLLKHASMTAPLGDHFEKAFGHLAAHPGLLRHAFTDHQSAGELIRERQVDHVIFTGSVSGGRAISRHCGEAMLDCHLELGGKDAAYVAADADVRLAAEVIVEGCMYNAGQSCCGIERVYVHASLEEAFVSRVRQLVGAYQLGDPTDPATTMGPLADPSAAELMERQVEEAQAGGAEIIAGGRRRLIGGSTFFEPTIVLRPRQDMAIMQEENFGPIMPVMVVGDDAGAVSLINDCQFGLTAAIWSADADLAEALGAELEVGTVFLNRCDYLDPALPWTGYKLSGRGSGLSRYAFYGLTKRKAIHFRLP